MTKISDKLIKSQGQIDYENDVFKKQTYHDGSPRKTWAELSDIAKWSWERIKAIK